MFYLVSAFIVLIQFVPFKLYPSLHTYIFLCSGKHLFTVGAPKLIIAREPYPSGQLSSVSYPSDRFIQYVSLGISSLE